MSPVLPPEFADLEPFADWCLPTEAERYAKRLASSMDEMQAFYDAAFPRLEQILAYLDDTPSRRPARGRRPAAGAVATRWSTSRSPSRCGARPGCRTAARPAWTSWSSPPSEPTDGAAASSAGCTVCAMHGGPCVTKGTCPCASA